MKRVFSLYRFYVSVLGSTGSKKKVCYNDAKTKTEVILCRSSITQCQRYVQPVTIGVVRVNLSNTAIILNLTALWTQAHATAMTVAGLTVRRFRQIVIADAGQNGVHSDST